MKISLFSLLIVLLASCAVQFNSGGKYSTGSAISSNIPTASIKYTKNGADSLRVSYKGEKFTVSIPTNKIRFSVVCSTPEDIILKSFDKTKVLIFVLKTKTWTTKEIPKECT